MIAKTVDITRFFPKSYKNTRTKIGNPLMQIGGFPIFYSSLFIIQYSSFKRISVMNDEIAAAVVDLISPKP